MTTAAWLRKYMSLHPSYAHDSVLPEAAVHDVLETCAQITAGAMAAPDLVPPAALAPVDHDATDERGAPLEGAPVLRLGEDCASFKEFLRKHLVDPAR